MHRFEKKDPPEPLLVGRRAIENLKEVKLLEDFLWDPLLSKWVLFCSIRLDVPLGSLINEVTKWYVLVDSDYPLGKIDFYPAIKEGLDTTFPHQNYNGIYDDGRPWRKGKLCLDSSVKVLGIYGANEEPRDSSNRLLWHFVRTIRWLELASKNELSLPGEPFELPHFPNKLTELIAFSESPVSLQRWMESPDNYGFVRFVVLKNDPRILITKRFSDTKNRDIYLPKWGDSISDAGEYQIVGLWIKLTDIPIIPPFQAPITWGELQETALRQGIDLFNILKTTARFFRDGVSHILMIGFPIPEVVSGKKMVMNWQAIKLPILSHGNKFANGFRKGELGYWRRDRTLLLRDHDQIQWIDTENWHRNEILNRGKLTPRVSQAPILQIGAGSLGSMISEQLVRADMQNLTIVDFDLLKVGNLSRHMLGMRQIRRNKALELASKLNQSVPHSKVTAISWEFSNNMDQINLSYYRVIIDCTGEDQVLYKLDQIPWNSPKIFISASLGYSAKRLYFYTNYNDCFSADKFFDLITPWLDKERSLYNENELPRDGIGCWHPVFPARIDDIWMMSSVAVKNIERFIQTPVSRPTLLVYEQKWDREKFCGIDLISQEEWDGEKNLLS